MPNKLTDIAITHISLVKAGANGKQVIYKSAATDPQHESTIDIKKTDNEKGIVYGIVYAPDQVDSQGDFTTADEIEKAAYAFMKSLNGRNVDVEHSFQSEDAFVAESWIIKSGDPIFPDEPEGSWAVAIKLESDELKELAKSGDIAGLSMAGAARKEPVEKAGDNTKAFSKFFEAFADAVSDIWFDFGGIIKKSQEGVDMAEEVKKFDQLVKEKLQKATKEASGALGEQLEKVDELQKSVDDATEQIALLKSENESLKSENEALKASNEALEAQVKEQGEKIAAVAEQTEEVKEAVQKSKQTKTTTQKTKDDETKGVM